MDLVKFTFTENKTGIGLSDFKSYIVKFDFNSHFNCILLLSDFNMYMYIVPCLYLKKKKNET